MKRLMLVGIFMMSLVLPTMSQGAVLFTENFDYDAGVLGDSAGQANVSGGNWVHFSGGGLLIECVDGNLAYPSYPASDVGRMIQIVRHTPGATAEDIYRQFTTQTPDMTLYASFLFKVTHDSMSPDTATHGQYFTMLMPSSSTTTHFGRVTTKMGSTAGKYKFGLRATSSNSSTLWTTGEYDVNTTYLIVLAYEYITGNTNDVAKLWINPSLTGSEPSADLSQTSALTTDPADVARMAIRQGSSTSSSLVTPAADIDGITVATTWGEITGVSGNPPFSTAIFSLMPCSPNPASRDARFSFSLANQGKVDLSVFNVLGQKVATVYSGQMAAGQHSISWNLKGQRGEALPNGVYFYNLSDGSRSSTRRMLILK